MDLNQEFAELMVAIADKIEIPAIEEIFIPSENKLNSDQKKANFGAIRLKDGSTGIFFVGLQSDFYKTMSKVNLRDLAKHEPLDLVSKFKSYNLFERTIALGMINAISHLLFLRSNFQFNYTESILDLLNLNSSDVIGMVGYFPPLVRKLNKFGNKLVVLELKKELIKKNPNWEITLEKRKLLECNKIICTSTTLINNTIDDILNFTNKAEFFALIGPTAGFIPDPLFKKKITAIGGSIVNNSQLFFQRIRQGERWGDSVSKFVMTKKSYPGVKRLINQVK
jgi:uncharacterized protein (DUF4213/DUF364 family)